MENMTFGALSVRERPSLLFVASKQPENVHVTCDNYAALSTVIEDRAIVEIAVQGAEGIGSAYNGGVNDWVIIGVGRHDTGSRPGKTTSEMSFA
jgi:hypothetical protein